MVIFINNLKRIFRKKSNLFFMVILPLALIIFVIGANSGGSHFSLGVVDNDNTKFTKLLVKQIGSENKINYLNHTEIKDSLIDFKNDYVIQIPKGFTKDLINGKNINIKGYSINGTNSSMSLKFNIESFIRAAKTIVKSSKGNEELFYKAIDKYEKGIINTKYENMDSGKVSKKNTLFSLGFLVFNMLMLGVSITPIILMDKKTKVYYRIFTGPINARNYTMQNFLSFLVVLIIQISIIFTFMINVFKIQFPSITNMFLLFIVFSIFVVAYSLFISSRAKSMRAVSTISTLTVVPMSMLGGCFWPMDIMPKALQNISNFIPLTWVLKAANKLMYNDSLYSIVNEMLILILFSTVFMLLASWRKKDIMN